KTHRTALPALPASVPSWLILPLVERIESAVHAPIKEEFFNKISPKRPLKKDFSSRNVLRGPVVP
ncbi:hypothetical protein, partial [Sulfitobacter sediminilitoris]|uniref:hypothetical protein n=1 Tax=Sulfitobacter sediminilitoris TaxID=2698830 RepID=UPI001953761A